MPCYPSRSFVFQCWCFSSEERGENQKEPWDGLNSTRCINFWLWLRIRGAKFCGSVQVVNVKSCVLGFNGDKDWRKKIASERNTASRWSSVVVILVLQREQKMNNMRIVSRELEFSVYSASVWYACGWAGLDLYVYGRFSQHATLMKVTSMIARCWWSS